MRTEIAPLKTIVMKPTQTHGRNCPATDETVRRRMTSPSRRRSRIAAGQSITARAREWIDSITGELPGGLFHAAGPRQVLKPFAEAEDVHGLFFLEVLPVIHFVFAHEFVDSFKVGAGRENPRGQRPGAGKHIGIFHGDVVLQARFNAAIPLHHV